MKKLLTLLLTLLMVFTLVGCNSKENTPVVQEPEKQEEAVEQTKEEPEVGGYIDVEDGTLTDELKDIFNKAIDGLLGVTYEPVELVATQVVAGTNYKFLANGTKTTNPITKGTYYITIYKDLQGNVELLDIETIEEKQEEAPKQDITQMSFWVVFYDQYGNELQRETLKYGTVPEYKTWLPEGFDKWVYKKSGKDVETLKAITGNTYYQAVCHEVNYSSNNPTPVPTPIPDPEYVQVTCLASQAGAFINSKVTASDNMEFIFDAKMNNASWSRCFGYWNTGNSGLAFQSVQYPQNPPYDITGGLMFYASDGTKTYQYVENDNYNNARITQRTTYDVKYNGTTANASYIKINGTQVKTFTTGTINTSKEIYIFDINGTNNTDSKQPLAIYYMQIYKDGLLVRDYIPVKTLKEIDSLKNAKETANIPAGTLCMYDKVEGKYYPSFGDVPFELACKVTFEPEKDADVEVGEVHNASGEKVTEIIVPSGTVFSTLGNTITIGGNNYTAVANSGWSFHSFEPASGTITSDTAIKVKISQDQP